MSARRISGLVQRQGEVDTENQVIFPHIQGLCGAARWAYDGD
jgi:hypothetical protein